jgi:pilus assembly protein Flp/PilA
MNSAPPPFTARASDDSGVTAIEYGLLAALIAVAILVAITATGTALLAIYVYWSTAVVNAL